VEGIYLPGVRVLCPPEVLLLEMSPSAQSLISSYITIGGAPMSINNFAILLVLPTALTILLAWRLPSYPRRLALLAGGMAFTFGLADWAMMSLLPVLGLSFGIILHGLIFLTLVRTLLFLLPVAALRLQARLHPQHAPSLRPGALLAGLGALNILISLFSFHAFYVEPFHVEVTRTQINAPALLLDRPLRIAQITDTHVERITRRETEMLALLEAYQPDLIVLTGDYVNADYTKDPTTIQHTRQLFSQLSAPYGVYAIVGNVDIWNQDLTSAIFDGLDIILLEDEVHILELPGGDLYILGVSTLDDARDLETFDQLMRDIPADAYTLLLYHKPTLFDAAAAQGVDLFLAGHTHGGQVRLPTYTTLAELSDHGHWYEMGLYSQGGTTIYVSRGLGMEGLTLPRVRFLCPPEIAGIELGPIP
jgi:hypothetical protein